MYKEAPEAGIASLLASRGRNGDSVLVHMTPGELDGLKQLAFAAGGQLTINPHTGLYEASFLKKLLPTLLGFGLNFLFPGLGALGSSLLVGGVETARTGDLSKGLMAGLGAYGGASLGSAVSTVGQQAGTAAIKSLPAGAEALTGAEAIKAAAPEAVTKALAPEALKSAATAPVTGANLQAGMSALRAAPGTALKGIGSQLGATGIAGLGTTASSLMTPELQPYDPEDPTFYISGGYDPYTGFKPGYYSKTYKPFGAAGGGIIALAEGGETKKPLSAANVQYQGSDAEKLQQYMQNLNQSFIPPPPPPPASVAPPGAGGTYIAGGTKPAVDDGDSFLRRKFPDLYRNIQNQIGGAAAPAANNYQASGYSKPLYRMTAEEKAAEDAAMAAKSKAQQQNTAAQTSPYGTLPFDFTGMDFSGLQNLNMAGIGGLNGYMPPAYTPGEVSYQPPVTSPEELIYDQQPINAGIGSFDQNFDQFGDEYNFAFAKGGVTRRGRKKRKHTPVAGKLVTGKGDGMSDSIRANINGDQEARLTDGEFVIPADVVSHLGNGSTDAGSKKLYSMMARVRKARTGRSQQAPQVNIDRMMP